MPLIATKQLCKSFRGRRHVEVRAIEDVSLEIPLGSFTVFTGPSGSGKTTLLSLIGALDRATSGQLVYDGRELSQCSDTELARIRRRMGFVFQDFGLLRELTTFDNIQYPLIPRGMSRRERAATTRELLQRQGIEHCALKRPDQLSGGEQQRVAVARALAGCPELLLADEPTSNLDASASRRFAATLCEIQAAGTTVVLATHDPQLLELASHVFQLDCGHLLDVDEKTS